MSWRRIIPPLFLAPATALSTALAAALAIVATVATVAACGGGSTGPTASVSCGESADARQPFLTPQAINTGFNGRDTYEAVLVANFGTFSITSRNGDVVSVDTEGCLEAGDSDIVAVLTSTGAGESTVVIESGAFRDVIGVVVADYSTAEYDKGDERYNNPADVNATDRVACSECHREGAGGAPHSPLSLAGNSDTALLEAIATSQYPGTCEDEDGLLCSCTPSGSSCASCPESDCSFAEGYQLTLEAFGGGPGEHAFDLTDDERDGIVAFMRAIKPEGL